MKSENEGERKAIGSPRGNPAHSPRVRQARTPALCQPRGCRRWPAPLHVRDLLRAVRPLGQWTAAPGRRTRRTRRLHCDEHDAPARVVLRGPVDRRRPRAHQLPADRGRLLLHHQPQRRDRRLRRSGVRAGCRRHSPRTTDRPPLRDARRARRGPGVARVRGAPRRRLDRVQCPGDRRARSPDDQLHERYDVAPEGRDDHASERVHEHGRHARPYSDDVRRQVPVDAADVPRERLDIYLDGDRRRRRARVPAQDRSAPGLRPHSRRTNHAPLRGSHGPHQPRERA